MPRRLPCALVVSAVVAVAPAQERRSLVGNVLDAAGQPVAGADVTLFWSPPGDATGGRADRIDVRTDARGRYTAAVLARATYSGFALGAADAQGRRALAPLRTGLAFGGSGDFRLADTAVPRRLEATGLDAWRPAGPLRWYALFGGMNVLRVEVPWTDDHGELPALPAPAGVLIADQRGEWLWYEDCEPRMVGGFPLGGVLPQATIRMAMPQPIAARVVVQDSDQAPVAGARIEAVFAGPTQSRLRFPYTGPGQVCTFLGVTDARGVAPVVLAGSPLVAGLAGAPPLRVTAPGRGSVRVGVAQDAARQRLRTGPGQVAQVAVTLPVAPCVRLLDGKVPLVGLEVTVQGEFATGKDSGYFATEALRTDDQGRLLLPEGLRANAGTAAFTSGPPAARRQTVLDLGDVEVGAIDVAACRTCTLQLLDTDGGPAGGQAVALYPLRKASSHVPAVAVTDAAGRCALALGPGDWFAVACVGQTVGYADLPASAAPGAVVSLQFEPLPVMRLRIVDGDGRPRAGMRVRQFMCSMTRPEPGDPRRSLASQLAQELSQTLEMELVSNAEGRLELRYCTPGGGTVSVAVGAAEGPLSEMFQLEPGAERTVVVR